MTVVTAGCSPSADTAQVAIELSDNRDKSTGFSAAAYDLVAGSWPGWRGGELEGVATAIDLPVQFNATSGMRWVASLDPGNSSPVIWGDRVFLTAQRTVERGAQLEVSCLDRATGGRIWTNEPVMAAGPTHRKNGYASATPATDGERLYVSFGSAGLFCFDFEGRQLWQKPLHARQHVWGAASSPIVFGGMVIQLCDQPEQGFIAAFDAVTGETRWRTRRQSSAGWSTPVIADVTEGQTVRHELVVQGSGSSRGRGWVIAYDPFTGAELWRVRGTTDVVCPTPIVAGGLIVSTSGRNGPLFAIRPGGRGDVTRSHVMWKHPRGGPYVPTGVAVSDRVYILRDEGGLECYDAANGKRLWQERLRGSFAASLTAGDGKLYATSERGNVYVIAQGDSFRLLATNRLRERCLATPAVAGNELFVRTDSRLYCFARSNSSQHLVERDELRKPEATARAAAP
jgi:outer membrane protein assembly factor BamB